MTRILCAAAIALLLLLEEAEQEDEKFCFFEPKNPLLGYCKTAFIHGIQIHEQILSEQSDS